MYMDIIMLQAMTAFPIVAIFIAAIAFLLSFGMLSGYNAITGNDRRNSAKPINPFWISLAFALLVLAFFIYRLLTFKGPWIT